MHTLFNALRGNICSRLLLALAIATAAGSAAAESQCTYSTYKWNVNIRRAVEPRMVTKPMSNLTDAEKDPVTGCTVCLEDQVKMSFPGLRPFLVCKKLAPSVEKII